jgi:hypothetical protein
MAYTTHVVTAADLAETGMLPRDEHSRPLTLLYGYVCEAPWTPNPTHDELRAGREQALDVYRRFLADEDATTVSASHPRQIQTYATEAPRTPAEPVRTRGVPWNLAIVGLVVVVIAVVAIMLGRSGAPDVPHKDDCLTGIVNDGVIIDPQRIDCGDAKAQFTVRASLDGKTWDDVKTACEPYKDTWPAFWATDEDSDKGTVLCLVLG